MEQLAVEMPAIAYYPPLPLYAGISAILCAGFLFLAFRKLLRDKKRGKAKLSITLAAVFAVATAGLVVGSYQQYVVMNTCSYDFRFLLWRRWGHCPFRIGWYGDAAIRIDCSRLATPSAALPTGGIRGIDDPTRLRYRRKRVAAEWIPS